MRFEFEVESLDGPVGTIVLEDPQLIVAGYTGRSREAVERHIAELARIGVAPPDAVPTFYRLPNWLLRPTDNVQIVGTRTSGEAEPVLIRLPDGALYVTVGSDQTDRTLEVTSVSLSKQVCPKLIASAVWPYEDIGERWDDLQLRSFAGPGEAPYQDGAVSHILDPLELLAAVDAAGVERDRALVLFLGTVPLQNGEFVFDERFEVSLSDEAASRELRLVYRLEQLPLSDTAP